MASVTLTDVQKVYEGGVHAVRDFNLTIADEEFVVFVGPSGCGKSTTLRMVAGLEDVTGGTIAIDGRVVNDVQPKDRDIAMVFQNYALYPHMSVFQNMAFGLKLRKFSSAECEQRVQRAAKILGIEHLLERKPKALSGGQRQRVALGRAIVRDPKCFLFDEPLSNLDAKLRVEMRVELKRLHKSLGSTTIYVTHDQEEAMTLGDNLVVMKDGLIQQYGRALDVYRRPVNRFVASFLGSPPMNFLEGTLVSEGGRLWFNEGSGRLPVPDGAAVQLRSREGQRVVLGARAEALADAQSARFATEDNFLNLQVELVQSLGDCMHVHLATPHHSSIVAQLPSSVRVAAGTEIPIFFDLERVHFFEPGERGASLALGNAYA